MIGIHLPAFSDNAHGRCEDVSNMKDNSSQPLEKERLTGVLEGLGAYLSSDASAGGNSVERTLASCALPPCAITGAV